MRKIAGVEYGFNTHKGKEDDIRNMLTILDTEEHDYDDYRNLRLKVNSKRDVDHGFKFYNRHLGMALSNSSNKDIQDFINGDGRNFKKGLALVNPYSGEAGSGNFLAGRDSAEKLKSLLGSEISKHPKSNFDINRYQNLNDELKKYRKEHNDITYKNEANADIISKKIMENTERLNSSKSELNNLPFYRIMKKNNIKKNIRALKDEDLNLISQKNKALNQGISEIRNKMNNARSNIDILSRDITDRDILENYKNTIENSLKDNDNKIYEWGWY